MSEYTKLQLHHRKKNNKKIEQKWIHYTVTQCNAGNNIATEASSECVYVRILYLHKCNLIVKEECNLYYLRELNLLHSLIVYSLGNSMRGCSWNSEIERRHCDDIFWSKTVAWCICIYVQRKQKTFPHFVTPLPDGISKFHGLSSKSGVKSSTGHNKTKHLYQQAALRLPQPHHKGHCTLLN